MGSRQQSLAKLEQGGNAYLQMYINTNTQRGDVNISIEGGGGGLSEMLKYAREGGESSAGLKRVQEEGGEENGSSR